MLSVFPEELRGDLLALLSQTFIRRDVPTGRREDREFFRDHQLLSEMAEAKGSNQLHIIKMGTVKLSLYKNEEQEYFAAVFSFEGSPVEFTYDTKRMLLSSATLDRNKRKLSDASLLFTMAIQGEISISTFFTPGRSVTPEYVAMLINSAHYAVSSVS